MEMVRKEGDRNVKREIEFYNLDAIITVDYIVNSKKATSVDYNRDLEEAYTFSKIVQNREKEFQ